MLIKERIAFFSY